MTQGLLTIALGLGWALPGLGAAPGGRVGQSLIAFRPALVMRGVLIGDPASIGTYSTNPMAQSRRQTRPLRISFSPVASAVRTCRCGPVKLMVEIMALGLGWRAGCLRCTDPTLSAVHHARGAVAICEVRLLPPTFVRLLPAAARAGRLLPHGLHASACAPPSHQLAPAAPAFANA